MFHPLSNQPAVVLISTRFGAYTSGLEPPKNWVALMPEEMMTDITWSCRKKEVTILLMEEILHQLIGSLS